MEQKKSSDNLFSFPNRHRIQFYFLSLVAINAIFIFLSIISYGEKFIFWEYAFSRLGATTTISGLSNYSFYFYDLGAILNGLVLLFLAHEFKQIRNKKYRFYRLLVSISAVGAFISITPHNLLDLIHMLGSGLMIGCLWLLITLFLFELKPRLKKYRFYFYQAILQIPILIYTLTFFSALPIRDFYQKFAVIALFISLIIIASQLRLKKPTTENEITSATTANQT